jgi:hypothetical protein
MERKILSHEVKEGIKLVGLIGLLGAIIFGPNHLMNSRRIVTPTSIGESKMKGLMGHTEYQENSNGSQEFKIYGGLGNYGSINSTFGLDIEGDGKVDILMINSSISSQLKKSLVRSLDYPTNKSEFDEADMHLEKLKSQFNLKREY